MLEKAGIPVDKAEELLLKEGASPDKRNRKSKENLEDVPDGA